MADIANLGRPDGTFRFPQALLWADGLDHAKARSTPSGSRMAFLLEQRHLEVFLTGNHRVEFHYGDCGAVQNVLGMSCRRSQLRTARAIRFSYIFDASFNLRG